MITLEEVSAKLNAMPLDGKLDFFRRAHYFTDSAPCSCMEFDGFVYDDESKCVYFDDGEYYVYVWKHNYGEFFYVGSGKKDRWKSIHGRCKEFYNHIDKADAVVYKVLDGIDVKTARQCERYLSANMSLAGYKLANSDWSYNNARFTELSDTMKEAIEKSILNIQKDNKPSECRKTMVFLERNGDHFFSEKYAEAN